MPGYQTKQTIPQIDVATHLRIWLFAGIEVGGWLSWIRIKISHSGSIQFILFELEGKTNDAEFVFCRCKFFSFKTLSIYSPAHNRSVNLLPTASEWENMAQEMKTRYRFHLV